MSSPAPHLRRSALIASVGVVVLISGCGGGHKAPDDRAAVSAVWTQATQAIRAHEYGRFCGLLTARMADSVLTAAGYGPESNRTTVSCTDVMEKLSAQMPDAPLSGLVITGAQAVGTSSQGGKAVQVSFLRTPGQWAIASLPLSASGAGGATAAVRSPEGRRVVAVLNAYYAALEAQDPATLCAKVTDQVQQRVIAVGSIQGAKTCPAAYRVVFGQIAFAYHSLPTVTKVTVRGQRARTVATVEGKTLHTPLRKIKGNWKVDVLGA